MPKASRRRLLPDGRLQPSRLYFYAPALLSEAVPRHLKHYIRGLFSVLASSCIRLQVFVPISEGKTTHLGELRQIQAQSEKRPAQRLIYGG